MEYFLIYQHLSIMFITEKPLLCALQIYFLKDVTDSIKKASQG